MSASPASAILVIDTQVDLIQGKKPVYNGSAVVARIRSLTERARLAGVPVVYLLDKDVAEPDSPGWQLEPGLHARDEDLRIRKDYADSFHHTDLHEQLQERGVTRVIVCGCTTDACVDMTARRAVSPRLRRRPRQRCPHHDRQQLPQRAAEHRLLQPHAGRVRG